MTAAGLLIVDKPRGPTSAQVVGKVRRLTGIKRVGHAGTLDPAASGVLPLCLGWATRLSEYLIEAGKTYEATIELGVSTSTYDSEGEILQRQPVGSITEADVKVALTRFQGDILQTPPAFSALKKDGVRLYQRARRGEQIDIEARPVRVDSIAVVDFASPHLTLRIDCGKGFYVRSLANDLGQALGVPAMLAGLVRSRVGPFRVDEAVTLDDLLDDSESGGWRKHLEAPDEALTGKPAILVDEAKERRLRRGQPVSLVEVRSVEGDVITRSYGRNGRFFGLARRTSPGQWKADKVFGE